MSEKSDLSFLHELAAEAKKLRLQTEQSKTREGKT